MKLLIQSLEDVGQIFLQSQSSSVAIVQRTIMTSSYLGRTVLFLQQVYRSQISIEIQTELGWMGIFIDVLMDACCSYITGGQCLLKPMCICCKDII